MKYSLLLRTDFTLNNPFFFYLVLLAVNIRCVLKLSRGNKVGIILNKVQ
jgi:hypothetical protein